MRFDKLAHEEDRQKEMVTGELTALVGGKEYDRPRPAKWFFHNHESEPTTEVAIKRAPAEDLYITLGNYDLAEGTATLKLVVNPVVNWIWFGFMLLALATGIVLVPDSVLERMTAGAAVPAAAAARSAGAASIALWLALGAGGALLLAPQPAAAQMASASAEPPEPVGADETWLVHNIMCQCTTCRHNLMECASEHCGHANAGSDRDPAAPQPGPHPRADRRVLHQEVRRAGGAGRAAQPRLQPAGLAVPLQRRGARGRRARLRRVSSRQASRRAPTNAPEKSISDPELADKLDDELRNLD